MFTLCCLKARVRSRTDSQINVESKKPAAKPAAKKSAKPAVYTSTGDPATDRLREQRLVEEADYQNVQGIL